MTDGVLYKAVLNCNSGTEEANELADKITLSTKSRQGRVALVQLEKNKHCAAACADLELGLTDGLNDWINQSGWLDLPLWPIVKDVCHGANATCH